MAMVSDTLDDKEVFTSLSPNHQNRRIMSPEGAPEHDKMSSPKDKDASPGLATTKSGGGMEWTEEEYQAFHSFLLQGIIDESDRTISMLEKRAEDQARNIAELEAAEAADAAAAESGDGATKKEDDDHLTKGPEQVDVEVAKTPEQMEAEAAAKISRILYALINCKLDEPAQASSSTPPKRESHFEENMREEAMILDAMAGPGASAAERQKVADEAAEVRRRLAERDLESVAESVARDEQFGKPARAALRTWKRAVLHERGKDSFMRLVNVATGMDRALADKFIGLDDLSVLDHMFMKPLLEVLRSPAFETLKETTGSFEEATKYLFDLAWEHNMKLEKQKAQGRKKLEIGKRGVEGDEHNTKGKKG